MRRMKKDMAGAAIVLGLAQAIMDAGLPVRLRVLLPLVENAVSGNAVHPMDIIRTRKGLTVEIGNTDAEGRLILCDALAEAATEKPALLVDMATLTGAARVALGPELAALFCNDDALAEALLATAQAEDDPMWRMPLWRPYRKMIDSKIADLNNVSESPHAGAVTAALYLQEFVEPDIPWAHLHVMAWNPQSPPGRLQSATEAGTGFVFGYLGGGQLPFAETQPGASFIFAFRALPLVLVISALTTLLFYWGVLQRIVQAFTWVLRRSIGVGGPLGLGA